MKVSAVALLLFLFCPCLAQARDLQQTDAAAAAAAATPSTASDVITQVASGPASGAANLFAPIPGTSSTGTAVSERDLPKGVEVVMRQTAGGSQPVASLVTVNTKLITRASTTERLRLRLPGGVTLAAVRRPNLDKFIPMAMATPPSASPAAGTAAAASAGAPGMPVIWAGEVAGQRLGLSSVTLLVAEDGGVYGNIRYLDRKTNTVRTFRIDPTLKEGADPSAAAAFPKDTTDDGIQVAALYPATDVTKHVITEYIEREHMPSEGSQDVDPTPPEIDTSPQAIYASSAAASAAAEVVLTPPADAEALAATMAASAGPDILAAVGPDGFLKAAKQWLAAKEAGIQSTVTATSSLSDPWGSNTTQDDVQTAWATDFTRIDVLMVYTAQAASAAGGVAQVVNRMRLAVAETNRAYVDSQIPIGMNLVDIRQAQWSESNVADPTNAALSAAQGGQIPNLHAWRDELGADMVSVTVSRATNNCGVGYLVPNNPALLYSSIQLPCFNQFTFAHELGHNQGCSHNSDAPDSTIPSYAYGFRRCDLGTSSFRTIMSYTCPGANTPRINLFSNPGVTTSGRPVGDGNIGHCARRLTETRSVVANARGQRVAVPVGGLVSWLGGRRCLDTPTWDNGRQLVIHECHGGGNQQLEMLGDGSLRFRGTNKCVDVRSSGTSDGTVVQLWDCNGTPAQRWFYDARSGLHPYVAPSKCLDVPGSRDANQQGLQIWGCNESPAQQWSTTANNLPAVFNPINRGLQSLLNNMCVDVFAFDYTNGKQLVMWPCNGANNQRWITDASGVVRSMHNTNKCLDATSGNRGAPVVIHDCHLRDNQRWFMDSMRRLRPRMHPNMCLDISGANANQGAPLQLWDCLDVNQQKWNVVY